MIGEVEKAVAEALYLHDPYLNQGEPIPWAELTDFHRERFLNLAEVATTAVRRHHRIHRIKFSYYD